MSNIENINRLHQIVGDAAKTGMTAPTPLDPHTLDVVEAVIIERRGKTRHTADAKAVSLVLQDVQKLRSPEGPEAA